MTKVFGPGSPQFIEAQASAAAPSGSAARAKAQTDFVGFAIHCAQGSARCASGHDDPLPDEPGGYTGYKGLFGAQEINPLLSGGPMVFDLLGNTIADPFGQPGFPGFDGMSAAVSLAYVAEMQEKGIPVTYAYISDAHDFHGVSGSQHLAFGPGSEGYVQQLQDYDKAFAAFFARLAAHGITKDNTLFVFTVDEGDHFVGVQKTDCDGVTTPCLYADGEVGEINANIDTLVADQFSTLASQFLGSAAPNAFTVHGDDAPPFYLAKKGSGPLSQTDLLTRQFERDIAKLTAVNPYTGATDNVMVQMADQTGMKALHMVVAADPARNGTFVLFADPNYFLTDFPASTYKTCINRSPGTTAISNRRSHKPGLVSSGRGSASWVPPVFGPIMPMCGRRCCRSSVFTTTTFTTDGPSSSWRRTRHCPAVCAHMRRRCCFWAACISRSTRPSVSSRKICWRPRLLL
jgi:hypothetical protein